MKKYFFVLLSLLVLSTPLIYWKILNSMKIEPKNHQVITEFIEEQPEFLIEETSKDTYLAIETDKSESDSYLSGYWDGQNEKWHGAIHWSTNPEYRRGHMLGSFDKKHKIKRYEK